MGRASETADLDALYAEQEKTYNDYVETQKKIGEKKEQIDNTKDVKFSRQKQMKAELDGLNDHADDAITDYYANAQLVENADLNLIQKARFKELDMKMVKAINQAKGKNDVQAAQAPPEPPPVAPPATPVVQTYVNAGMKITCPFSGGAQVPYMVTPEKRILLEGTPMANIMDNKPITNIPPIGLCTSFANPAVAATAPAFTPKPCLIAPLGPWTGGKTNVLVGGQPALINTCTLQCSYGGVVTFVPEPPAPPSAGGTASQIAAPFLKLLNKKVNNLPKDALKFVAEETIAQKARKKGTKKIFAKCLAKTGGFVVGLIYNVGQFAYKKATGATFSDPLGAGDYLRSKGLPNGVADFGSHVVNDAAETGEAALQIVAGQVEREQAAGMDYTSKNFARYAFRR